MGISIGIHVLLFALSATLWGRSEHFRMDRLSTLAATVEEPREIVVEFVPETSSADPTFVEVPPSQATDEPPKNSVFYSAENSVASNPNPSTETGIPKVDGTQEAIPKSVDVLVAAEPRTAQVEIPPENEAPIDTPAEENAKDPKDVKEAAESKVEPTVSTQRKLVDSVVDSQELPTVTVPKEEKSALDRTTRDIRASNGSRSPGNEEEVEPKRTGRPRKLAQLIPQAAPGGGLIVGPKMRQDGGVMRFGLEPSFDVRSSEFGAYDAAIVAAIQKRWYDLIESRELPRNETGKVVLEFRLYADGQIGELTERESEVSPLMGLVCQRAVTDPAPYAPWPSDLRRLVGKEYRQVRFVFHYN